MAGFEGRVDVRYLGVEFQGPQFVRLSLLEGVDEFLHAVDVPRSSFPDCLSHGVPSKAYESVLDVNETNHDQARQHRTRTPTLRQSFLLPPLLLNN